MSLYPWYDEGDDYVPRDEEGITCDICGEEEGARVHTDTELHPDDAADGLYLHPFADPRKRDA